MAVEVLPTDAVEVTVEVTARPALGQEEGVSKHRKVTMDGRTSQCINQVCVNIGKFPWMEEHIIEIKLSVSKYMKVTMD
ncbi:hypothetical protein RRG08_054763 [Elysia crispata]|uniref:Uncharacterized protein n=1 Tax=Elysia crispata TaxID=231223 RepID=A0AAE0YYW6_9GAST|nr:hypothetical protein RRG08_054763 [Elysia crispata]